MSDDQFNCEACGRPDTKENPTHEYRESGHYHDQCADELGISEGEMA